MYKNIFFILFLFGQSVQGSQPLRECTVWYKKHPSSATYFGTFYERGDTLHAKVPVKNTQACSDCMYRKTVCEFCKHERNERVLEMELQKPGMYSWSDDEIEYVPVRVTKMKYPTLCSEVLTFSDDEPDYYKQYYRNLEGRIVAQEIVFFSLAQLQKYIIEKEPIKKVRFA